MGTAVACASVARILLDGRCHRNQAVSSCHRPHRRVGSGPAFNDPLVAEPRYLRDRTGPNATFHLLAVLKSSTSQRVCSTARRSKKSLQSTSTGIAEQLL